MGRWDVRNDSMISMNCEDVMDVICLVGEVMEQLEAGGKGGEV